jgi:hypothetical protein
MRQPWQMKSRNGFGTSLPEFNSPRYDSSNFAECKISWPGPLAGGYLPQPTLRSRCRISPRWGRETQAGASLPFCGICAIMASMRGFGFKKRNFGGFSSSKEARPEESSARCLGLKVRVRGYRPSWGLSGGP